jgi:ATP-dependent DNA helicase PIF1
MLTKNIDVSRGLVNGARGVVVKFDTSHRGIIHNVASCKGSQHCCSKLGLPVVRFTSGLEMTVSPEKFLVKMGGGVMAIRRQLPLRLAWAISVHKSQVCIQYICMTELVYT